MESKITASEMLDKFLSINNIDATWYSQQLAAEIPRYARIVDMMVEEEENNDKVDKNESEDAATEDALNTENKGSDLSAIVSASSDDVGLSVEKIRQQFPLVKWLKRSEFVVLPADFELLKATQSIKDKRRSLYGMDAASGFACEFLDPQPGDKILDIACAPGGKLMLISELMKKEGMLIGVDVSLERLYTCRSLLRKNKTGIPKKMDDESSWYLGVFHYDGTTFDIPAMKTIEKSLVNDIIFDSVEEIELSKKNHYGKRLSKKQKAEVISKREMIYSKAFPKDNEAYFDKVLVDAECTHDGSIKHVTKSFPTTSSNVSEESTDASTSAAGMSNLSFVTRDMTALVELQLTLLRNGFKNLKPSGVLVYSTCSFCKCQNEGVITKFLSMEPTARMIPIDQNHDNNDNKNDKMTQQIPATISLTIPGCYLFSPDPSKTSGLFVSRITKILLVNDS